MGRVLPTALLTLLAPMPRCSADDPARVVSITDGDTFHVLIADKTQVKIREGIR